MVEQMCFFGAVRHSAVFLGALAALVVTSDRVAAQCEEVVRASPMNGAMTYELYAAEARICSFPCNLETGIFLVPEGRHLVSVADEPMWVIRSAPEFTGLWIVVGRSASGGQVASAYVGEVGPHAAVGAPFLATGATEVPGCIGQQVFLTPKLLPAGTSYQWFRDGIELPGASSSTLAVQVDTAAAAAVYTCVATNGCGETSGGPFLISATDPNGVNGGIVDWESCTEVGTRAQDGGYWGCSYYITEATRQGSCNALWTQLAPNSFTFSPNPIVSGTAGTEDVAVSFSLDAPAVLSFESVALPIYCFSDVYDRAYASISGPVSADLKPSATGGTGSITLPAGTYTIQSGVFGGSISCGWNCGGCGNTCWEICTQCSAWGRLTLSVSFAPILFDVPDQYPSIQSAIDAAPIGESSSITIAPGVFSESFDLGGKNVVIQGSTLGATIIDGSALVGSIARFSGGEPPSAGVENIVFRNAISGSPLPGGDAGNGGGAISGSDSSAFIKACRFEACAAGYGGAIHLARSQSSIEDCVFIGNHASREGGALYISRTTTRIINCTFADNLLTGESSSGGSAIMAIAAQNDGDTVELLRCAVTANRSERSAAAVEFVESSGDVAGRFRVADCQIANNISELSLPLGAAGLRVAGQRTACVLAGETTICGNSPRDVAGAFMAEAQVTICGCAADINGDGIVSASDLARLMDVWSESGLLDEDVDHDGTIGPADLAALLNSWGLCP